MANNTVKLAVEEATKKTTAGDGRIVRIIGPVVDVKFDGAVPPIYNALTVEAETPIGHLSTILEVESQLPGGVVRTVAMSSTDGLQRGLIATDTGEPMKMPVGPKTLGRIWNVMGPLLGRFHRAKIAMPGGCNLGARKIDMHILGLEALGVEFDTAHGYINANAPQGLRGTTVTLEFASVGATENLIMASVRAKGTTVRPS